MKRIIIFSWAIFVLVACNNKSEKEKQGSASWQLEKQKEYQLVKPIDYKAGFSDAYNLPIRNEQWYLICKETDYRLLPIRTESGSGPDFIENITKWQKIAVFDTVNPNLDRPRLSGVFKMVVVCCTQGSHVEPSLGLYGEMAVVLKK